MAGFGRSRGPNTASEDELPVLIQLEEQSSLSVQEPTVAGERSFKVRVDLWSERKHVADGPGVAWCLHAEFVAEVVDVAGESDAGGTAPVAESELGHRDENPTRHLLSPLEFVVQPEPAELPGRGRFRNALIRSPFKLKSLLPSEPVRLRSIRTGQRETLSGRAKSLLIRVAVLLRCQEWVRAECGALSERWLVSLIRLSRR